MFNSFKSVFLLTDNDDDDDDDDKFFDAQEGSFDRISLEANSPLGSDADTISLGARASRTHSSDSVYEPPPPQRQGEVRADILPLSSDKRMAVSVVYNLCACMLLSVHVLLVCSMLLPLLDPNSSSLSPSRSK